MTCSHETSRSWMLSAIALARESAIPIIVFSLNRPGGLLDVLRGEGPHTMISEDAPRAKEAAS